MDKADAAELVTEGIKDQVLLFSTSNGPLLGFATDDGDVFFRDIIKLDTDDPNLTKLVNSEETTKIYTLAASGKVIYGFECFAVPLAGASVTVSNIVKNEAF